ncbi:MAG: hypothetical protein Q4A16_09175 [Lautropia sp.]|nr:hypothetical protein [Lautropia sp.]
MREYLGPNSQEACNQTKSNTGNLITSLYQYRIKLKKCLPVLG